jgi:hypothetical protein
MNISQERHLEPIFWIQLCVQNSKANSIWKGYTSPLLFLLEVTSYMHISASMSKENEV